MSDITGLLWIATAGVLFGSQFIPSKYCPGFKSGAYNISMTFGILAGSIVAVATLGFGAIDVPIAALSFFGGILWVSGNYLLIIAVAKAGMARAFCIINFSAVFSFIGGGAALGELAGKTATGLAMMIGAVVLVVVGSLLVTTTTPSRNDGKSSRADVMRGMLAAFVATIFFSVYNVIIAFIVNKAGTPPATAFITASPGILAGAVLVAALPFEKSLGDWRRAPSRWHGLALVQGLVWAVAMMCIMAGWQGTGIAIGTPVQVGTQTIVSSVWGILLFREFRALENRGAAYVRYAAGALLTLLGITAMAFT